LGEASRKMLNYDLVLSRLTLLGLAYLPG
jgi:hypothetical protein